MKEEYNRSNSEVESLHFSGASKAGGCAGLGTGGWLGSCALEGSMALTSAHYILPGRLIDGEEG